MFSALKLFVVGPAQYAGMHVDSMLLDTAELLGCCRAAIWFVVHHFWFLDVRVGGLPVRLLCRLLLAALTPAVLLPGLIRSGALQGPGLHAHAAAGDPGSCAV